MPTIRLLCIPTLVLSVLLLSGCAYESYYAEPYRPPARYRPAYYYDYHYYPSTRVYFHLYSGYYYYRARGTWLRVRMLPPYIHLGPRDRIHLRIWSERPYIHHGTHLKRYRPHPRYRGSRDRDHYERSHNRSNHQRYLGRDRR